MILAGVALNLTIGQNGIISRAQDASEITTIANEKEAITLAYTACKMDDYQSDVSSQDLQDELNRNNHNTTVTSLGNNLKVLFNDTGHLYTVGQDGQITDEYEEQQKKIIRAGIIYDNHINERIVYCELANGTVFIPKSNIDSGISSITSDVEYEKVLTTSGVKQAFGNGFIDNDGKVYTGGNNEYGQVGDGTNENKVMPVCISDMEGNPLKGKKINAVYSDVSVDNYYDSITYGSMAIDDDGKIYIWGYGYNLPICISEDSNTVLKGKNIVKIEKSIENNYFVALDEDGKVYTWSWAYDSGEKANPICINKNGSGLENVDIIDVICSEDARIVSALDISGKLYYIIENQMVCLTDIEGSPFKDMKIEQIFTYNNMAYFIDDNNFLYVSNGENGLECITTSNLEGNILNGVKMEKLMCNEWYSTRYIVGISTEGKAYIWNIIDYDEYIDGIICLNNIEGAGLKDEKILDANNAILTENGEIYGINITGNKVEIEKVEMPNTIIDEGDKVLEIDCIGEVRIWYTESGSVIFSIPVPM